jgi:hypothetical protein
MEGNLQGTQLQTSINYLVKDIYVYAIVISFYPVYPGN